MKFINGTDLRLFISLDGGINYGSLFHSQECTLNLSGEASELDSKDISGGSKWRSFNPQTKSASITARGLIRYDTPISHFNVSEIFDLFDNEDSTFHWAFAVAEIGQPKFEGDGFFIALNQTAAASEPGAFDVAISVVGDVGLGLTTSPRRINR